MGTLMYNGVQVPFVSGCEKKESLVNKKDIKFYDYDGSIVDAWTLTELSSKTDLPNNPSHDGLTAQGWNWSLADLQTANRAMNVGQMYITDDSKTRLYITIAAEGRMTLAITFSQTVSNGVTWDWGDGGATTKVSSTRQRVATHTYAAIGDYVITLDVAQGCVLGFPTYIIASSVVGYQAYKNMFQRIELGERVTSIGSNMFEACDSLASVTIPNSVTSIGNSAFYSCGSLTSVTIPNSVTSINSSMFGFCSSLASVAIPNSVTSINYGMFRYCYSLASVTIPNSVTSINGSMFEACSSFASVTIPNSVTGLGTATFQNCTALASVTIPNSVTSIDANMFYSCTSLASVTIPNSVTKIGVSAFGNCPSVAIYHILPITPPTLSSTNAFSGIASDCIMYVPVGTLAAYQSATNWATYASYMREEGI